MTTKTKVLETIKEAEHELEKLRYRYNDLGEQVTAKQMYVCGLKDAVRLIENEERELTPVADGREK